MQLKDLGYTHCNIEASDLSMRPFRLKLTDLGKQLVASSASDIGGDKPSLPWLEYAVSFFSAWVNNMGAVDVIGRFTADGGFTQPIFQK